MVTNIAEAIEALEQIEAFIDLPEADYLNLQNLRLALLVMEYNEKVQRERGLNQLRSK